MDIAGADGGDGDAVGRWGAVGAAFVGLYCSVGVLVLYSFGLIAPAIAADFHWRFAQIAPALGAFSVTTMLVAPMFGQLIDRVGERRVAMLSTVALGGAFAALALLPPRLVFVYAAFVVIGVVGGGTLPAAYARLIVGRFDRQRGLALGVAMTGVGFGAIGMPLTIASLLDAVGWRWTCAAVGAGTVAIALPILAIGFRPAPASALPQRALAGTSETWRTRRFWVLAICAALAGVFVITGIGNFVPLLVERGLPRSVAAGYQAVVGVAVILARVFIGALLDRFAAPRLMLAVFATSVAGMATFAAGDGPAVYLVAAVAIGIAVGVEIDVLAYLVSRYFDRDTFGQVFGLMFAAYSLGGAAGSGGVALLPSGSTTALLIVAAALAASATLFLPSYSRTAP